MASMDTLNLGDGVVAAIGGAIVSVLIYSSSYFGDQFQSIMSALPSSVILIIYQYRKDRTKRIEMLDRVGRNELALATCVVLVIVASHLFPAVHWAVLSMALVVLYGLLIAGFSQL
jgi:hypothetical protein